MDMTGDATQMLPCLSGRNFPEDLGCWVFINYIDEDGLWVMLESEEPIMRIISDTLNITDIVERVQNPSVNDVVSALNTDHTWYRAVIEAVEPEIKIRFIDFGDTLVVSKENLAPLPSSLFSLRPLAMKVHLPPDSTLQPVVGLKMFVKSVCSRMGSVVVDIIHIGDDALTLDSSSKDDALTCSRLECPEISSHLVSTDMLTFESISLLDVPPPTGFSSDVLSDQEPDENDSVVVKMQLEENDALFPNQEPDKNDSLQSKPQLEENDALSSNPEPVHQALDSHDSLGPKPQLNENDARLPKRQEPEDSNVILAQEDLNKIDVQFQVKSSQNVVEALSSQGSSILEPDPEIVENTAVSSEHHVESSGAICYVKDVNESVSSSSSDQLLDGDKSQCAFSQVLEESLPPKVDSTELQNPAGNLCRDAVSSVVSKAVMIDHMTSVMSDDISTSTNDQENLPSAEENQSAISNCSEHVNQCASSIAISDPCGSIIRSEDSAYYPGLSVLEQFPSIGGGYAAHNAAADLGTKQNLSTPRIITKGCSNESSPLVCEQGAQHPLSSSSPSSKHLETSKISSQKSISKDEFKTILEFELSIIREHSRLQILQLQRKMEQNMNAQINALKDDVARQLVNFQNEVKSRIGLVNDSVVRKMADIYSDITLLKNDHEMNVHSQSRPSRMAVTGKHRQPSQGMQDFPPVSSSQARDPCESIQHCMNEFRVNVHSHRDADKRNGNYRSSYESQHQGQFSSEFNKKTCNSMDDMKGLSNSPMEGFKDGRKGRDFHHNHQYNEPNSTDRGSNNNYYRDSSMHQSLDKHLDEQHSSFPVGQFNANSLKMDHFNPSESGLEANADPGIKKTGSGSIIIVSNFNTEKITPDLLFNLIGVYGNVQRIKILQDGKKACIEMENSAQAEEVIKHLNRVPLMGQRLYVSPCSFPKLNFVAQDLEANTYKDYTRHQIALRYPSRFKNFKWDPTKLFSPSSKLMITNVMQTVSDDKLKEVFAKHGFSIQHISNHLLTTDKKVVYATFSSIEEAVSALTVMHLQETSDWSKMRISFAKPEKFSR